jgi:hypothetical protein
LVGLKVRTSSSTGGVRVEGPARIALIDSVAELLTSSRTALAPSRLPSWIRFSRRRWRLPFAVSIGNDGCYRPLANKR